MFTRRQPAMYLGLIAMFAAALACQGCSHDGEDLGSPPVDQSNDVGDKVARPNLRVETITHTAVRASDGKYNVTFYVTVANRGTATSPSFVVGAKGWGTPTISTCTGLWRATNTSSSLGVGATRTLVIYGPGFVGPRVTRGTVISVNAYADVYCAVTESSEGDNARTQSVRVGY